MKNNNVDIFNKVFMWLALGLIVSFGVGYYISTSEELLYTLLVDIGILPLAISTLVIAFVFKLFINKLPTQVLYILYIVFSGIIGITIASVFVLYELSSIISIFLLTSLIFVVMAVYGYTTKKDLTGFGSMLMIALLVVIIFSLISYFFLQSETINIIISAVSALIFTGFIAYDIQKIKNLVNEFEENKLVIYGAFELYLDFINLFLDLIRLFGKER